MTLTQDIANVVQSVSNLTAEVVGKMGEIDHDVIKAHESFEAWKGKVEAKDIHGEALYSTVVDLTGLNTDYYYPVWWQMPGNNAGESRISISRSYNADTGLNPFGDGNSHIAGLNMQLEGTAYPWNGDANFLTIKRLSQTYRKTVRAVKFGFKCIARPINGVKPLLSGNTDGGISTNRLRSGCYLRGGLKYQVAKNFNNNFWFSREDGEVSICRHSESAFEIDWKAKAYHKDDPFLEDELDQSLIAYMQDYDNRYALKVGDDA